MTRLPRASALLALALLAMPFAPVAAPAGPPLEACGDRPIHPPIHISETYRGGYAVRDPSGGVVAYAPGVVGGSGTADDPYVIEGWCIVRAGILVESAGIRIDRSDSHAVIRDVVLMDTFRGVLLSVSSNVTVEDSRFAAHYRAIEIDGGHGHVVHGNHISQSEFAITLWQGDGHVVRANRIEAGTGTEGISLHGSIGTMVVDNVVKDVRRDLNSYAAGAISVLYADGPLVASNVLVENDGPGLTLLSTRDAVVERNRIAHNGLGVKDGSNVGGTYRWNTVEHNARGGLHFYGDYERFDVVDNLVRSNGGAGLTFDDWWHGTPVLRGNNVEGNLGGGVVTLSSERVDARENWWGCAGGPDDPACDGIVGDRVAYDPWLTAPNPHAGVDA